MPNNALLAISPESNPETIHLEEAEDFVVQELAHLQLLAGLQEGLGHILPAGIGDVNK